MDKTVRKINLQDADQHDIIYWKSQSPEEKLDMVQSLREIYYVFRNESRTGFQRFIALLNKNNIQYRRNLKEAECFSGSRLFFFYGTSSFTGIFIEW